jgi:hypothetical protein
MGLKDLPQKCRKVDTCRCTVIVSVEDVFESVDGLLFIPDTLGLHYTSVKQGRVFGGAPTNVVQTLRSCCYQYLAAAGLRRVLTKFSISAAKPCFIHQVTCDRLVSATVRHLAVCFSGSCIILARYCTLHDFPASH